MPESRSLSELTRQIAPPTKNGHAPPPTESRKSYQSVNPVRVRAGFATILPPEPKDFGFPEAARRVMGITPPHRQSASFMVGTTTVSDRLRTSDFPAQYECPRPSLLIMASVPKTNKIEPRSYSIIPSCEHRGGAERQGAGTGGDSPRGGPPARSQDPTTSFLTAATLIYAIGAGITAAAGTRLALQWILVKGFKVDSFQLQGLERVLYCYFSSLPPRVGSGHGDYHRKLIGQTFEWVVAATGGVRSARGYLESPKPPAPDPRPEPGGSSPGEERATKGTITDLMSHSQFHCTGRAYLDMHGLIFETSICYWQDQPESAREEEEAAAAESLAGGQTGGEPGGRSRGTGECMRPDRPRRGPTKPVREHTHAAKPTRASPRDSSPTPLLPALPSVPGTNPEPLGIGRAGTSTAPGAEHRAVGWRGGWRKEKRDTGETATRRSPATPASSRREADTLPTRHNARAQLTAARNRTPAGAAGAHGRAEAAAGPPQAHSSEAQRRGTGKPPDPPGEARSPRSRREKTTPTGVGQERPDSGQPPARSGGGGRTHRELGRRHCARDGRTEEGRSTSDLNPARGRNEGRAESPRGEGLRPRGEGGRHRPEPPPPHRDTRAGLIPPPGYPPRHSGRPQHAPSRRTTGPDEPPRRTSANRPPHRRDNDHC
uniref:Uncharacterized protein n=1 Tax=Trichinella nativa TaxID=6335 RepID=A0A0V1KN65_9BILA